MIEQNGRAFNEWLRAQLRAKKMSQRQLALQSGVDHSTISRLIRGERMPSLGTATKLARGLREIHDNTEPPQYLGVVSSGTINPVAGVEYALRADELLGEPDVRQVMEFYLTLRIRRFGGGTRVASDPPGRVEAPTPMRPHVWSSGAGTAQRSGVPGRSSLPARPVARPGRPPGRF